MATASCSTMAGSCWLPARPNPWLRWRSPSYPIGAFSYSSGIEWAAETGDIKDADTLRRWLAVVIREGGGFCDAVFFTHAHRSLADTDDRALTAVAELAAAFAPSK